jgi:hypothetical protein
MTNTLNKNKYTTTNTERPMQQNEKVFIGHVVDLIVEDQKKWFASWRRENEVSFRSLVFSFFGFIGATIPLADENKAHDGNNPPDGGQGQKIIEPAGEIQLNRNSNSCDGGRAVPTNLEFLASKISGKMKFILGAFNVLSHGEKQFAAPYLLQIFLVSQVRNKNDRIAWNDTFVSLVPRYVPNPLKLPLFIKEVKRISATAIGQLERVLFYS